MNRKEAASLLVSGLAISGGVLSAYFTFGTTAVAPLVLGEGVKAFSGLGGNLVANAIQAKLIDNHPQDDILKNGDLTRAIGRAIFELCGKLAEETSDKYDKKTLEKLAQTSPEKWENLIIGGEYEEGRGLSFSNIDPDEISAEKSVQYVNAQSDKLDEIKSLTPEVWENIIAALYKNERYSLSPGGKKELAEKLHTEFARALRKVLIDDFSKDGKAFASMQFRIFGEILTYTHQNFVYAKETYELTDAILPIVIGLSKQVEEINRSSPRNYSAENESQWKKIFFEFKSFRETLDKTYQNTETIIDRQTEHGNKLDKIIENQSTPPKSSKPAPKGFINHPREKNDYFVEQGNVFARIDEHLENHHLGYLHGTHGLGKTTTLVEYAYARVKNYDFVFYVLATDGAIENELAILADRHLENVSEDTPAQKALKVKSFLENEEIWQKENKNWLIIFDNLESVEPISKYFPNTEKGDCLYSCNDKLFVTNDRRIDFEQFSQTEAELFIFQKLNQQTNAEHKDISPEDLFEIRKLVERLGRLPLSLNIAAAYLVETKVSIDDYVGLLNANVQKFLKYQNEHLDSQHKTAYEAFLITLDKISNHKGTDEDDAIVGKLAETFLDLLIFVAPEDIPEELIKNTLFQTVETGETKTPQNILFSETVALLQKYGLIKKQEKPFKYKEELDELKTLEDGTTQRWEERETMINVFATYRTLQDVLSIRTKIEVQKSLFEKFLIVFNDLLPDPEVVTWEIFGKYAIHVFFVAEQIVKSAIFNDESWRVYLATGLYFKQFAKHEEAEKFYLLAKTTAENFYNLDHENTATSYNNLALLYILQGKYKEAEDFLVKALTIRKKVLGEQNSDTAGSYNNLAELYRAQGKYKEAETLYKQSLKISEKIFGKKHQSTAIIYNNLGELYRVQGRYKEAEPLYKKDLTICKIIHGEYHPSTATGYNSLALLYYAQGRYEKAEPLFKKVIVIFQGLLGEDHSDTARSYNNLGGVYLAQSKLEEAEPLFKKAIGIYEKVVGENHPAIAQSYNNLAEIYRSRGNYERAEELFNQSLEIRQNILGKNHPETAQSYNNLAFLYYSQGRYELGEKLFKRVIEIFESLLGENHPDTAQSYNNLAVLYNSQGKYELAKELLEKSLEIRRKILGEIHLDTAKNYNNLGGVYLAQSKLEEAEPLFKKAIKFYKKVIGENHPAIAQSYSNLAQLYQLQGKYDQAEELFKKSLGVYEKSFGENHPETATIYNNLAGLYFIRENFELAKGFLKKSLKALTANFGENHPNVAASYGWLGAFYLKEEKYREALHHFYKAREIYLKFFTEEHPDVKNLQVVIDRYEQTLGE